MSISNNPDTTEDDFLFTDQRDSDGEDEKKLDDVYEDIIKNW